MKNFKYYVFMMLVIFMFIVPNVYADVNADANAGANAGAIAIVAPGAIQIQGDEGSRDISNVERSFPIGQTVNFPGLPGYFGENSPGHQFIPLAQINMYNSKWKVVGHKVPKGIVVKLNPRADKVAKKLWSKYITSTAKMFNKEVVNVSVLGFGSAYAEDENPNSADVQDGAYALVSKYGATHIQFLGEGIRTELDASSWSIGLNYTAASAKGITAGGTGIGGGKSGYWNHPWQNFMYVKVTLKDPNYKGSIYVEPKKVVEQAAATKIELSIKVDEAIKADIVK